MLERKPNITTPRFQVVPLLARKFHRDYEDTVDQYDPLLRLEITGHLLNVLQLFLLYQEPFAEALYQQYREKEEAFLKKYDKTLKPYTDRQFYKYFDCTTVLAEKDIYPQDVFNRLPAGQ